MISLQQVFILYNLSLSSSNNQINGTPYPLLIKDALCSHRLPLQKKKQLHGKWQQAQHKKAEAEILICIYYFRLRIYTVENTLEMNWKYIRRNCYAMNNQGRQKMVYNHKTPKWTNRKLCIIGKKTTFLCDYYLNGEEKRNLSDGDFCVFLPAIKIQISAWSVVLHNLEVCGTAWTIFCKIHRLFSVSMFSLSLKL